MRASHSTHSPPRFAVAALFGLVVLSLAVVLAYRPAKSFAAHHLRSDFETAWDAAEVNVSSVEGAAYAQSIQPALTAAQQIFAQCVATARPLWPRKCRVVLAISARGTVAETLIDHTGSLGSCAARATVRLRFPPPPRLGWRIGFRLTPAPAISAFPAGRTAYTVSLNAHGPKPPGSAVGHLFLWQSPARSNPACSGLRFARR